MCSWQRLANDTKYIAQCEELLFFYFFSNQSGGGGARLSGESLEATADASVKVALASPSALEAVVVGNGCLLDRTRDVGSSGHKCRKSVDSRGAARPAGVGADLEQVLGSVDTRSSKSNPDLDSGPVLSGSGSHEDYGTGGDSVDDLVGKVKQRGCDPSGKGGMSAGGGQSQGHGGVRLSELTGETQGEGLVNKVTLAGRRRSVDGIVVGSSRDQCDGLDLRCGRNGSVGTGGKGVISLGAHAGSAVDSAPAGIASAGTGAVGVPVEVCGRAHGANTNSVVSSHGGNVVVRMPGVIPVEVLVEDRSKGELVHELASSMSGARVRAGLASAPLALVSAEALALSNLAVADSLSCALGVVVGATLLVRGVNPGELERAEA